MKLSTKGPGYYIVAERGVMPYVWSAELKLA